MPARLETACYADIGGRSEQQDRVAAFNRDDTHLLALADGLGGHEGGALAAQALVDTAREMFYAASLADIPVHLLTDIVHRGHRRINTIGTERGIRPSSTCVLLYVTGNAATWAHVGDSRLYRFVDGDLIERTTDHSVVELMRMQGRITEQEMKTHPDQNRLYGAVGGGELPQVETGSKPTAPADGFLLASDGLWENASETELEAVFTAADLRAAVQHLVYRAKSNGGTDCDNISVVAARYRRAPSSFWSRLGRTLRPRPRRKAQ